MKEQIWITLTLLPDRYQGEACPCCGNEAESFSILLGDRLVATGIACEHCDFSGSCKVRE